jgi:archaemetzincin
VTPEIQILNNSTLQPGEFKRSLHLLAEVFGATVSVARATLDLSAAYDASRGQSNSTVLLAQILEKAGSEAKRIAVVDVDLFIPILTFVFGEAQLDGTAAVVSTHRLHNQFYGLPRNHGLMVERLEKEIIHELGHTFGLLHCHNFECVMRSSTYVEEIDLKNATMCTSCSALLAAAPTSF